MQSPLALLLCLSSNYRVLYLHRIPVYILNALYLSPLTLWTYLNFGRPNKPSNSAAKSHCTHQTSGNPGGIAEARTGPEAETEAKRSANAATVAQSNAKADGPPPADDDDHHHHHHHHHHHQSNRGDCEQNASERHHRHEQRPDSQGDITLNEKAEGNNAHQGYQMSGHDHHHTSPSRPMFATVTAGVCHCGAGCLLGDIVGEWLVYGTGAQIRGRMLWAEFLIGTLSDQQSLFLSSFMALVDHSRIQITPSRFFSAFSSSTSPSHRCLGTMGGSPSTVPPKPTSCH